VEERYCAACAQVVRPTRLPIDKILGTAGVIAIGLGIVLLFGAAPWIGLLAILAGVAAFIGSARAERWAQAVCPICSGSELADPPKPATPA